MDTLKRLIPAPLFRALQPPYHYTLATLGALWYRFPSRSLLVVGVTGTKGKSSTTEIVNAMLEGAGHTTALANTIRFKIGGESAPNRFKMTMPGRFFMQRFLREAVRAGCTHAILEMTSEGVKQYRHKHIYLDALIFTNLAPEHIEAHGSYEKYVEAKLKLRELLEHSPKRSKWMIANTESPHAEEFLKVQSAQPLPYSTRAAEPYHVRDRGIDLTFDNTYMHSPLLGEGNLANIVAAATFAKAQGIDTAIIKRAVEHLERIAGRGERVDLGQSFTVVVDYAHTPESLEQLYRTFGERRKMCVLGSTGGGRDRWKRPNMGAVADTHCSDIILTDEDPYDEDSRAIVSEIAQGIRKRTPRIIIDRRAAIKAALERAREGDVVLISGKGTDPYIMGPRGSKVPWSDRGVAEEELRALLGKKGGRSM